MPNDPVFAETLNRRLAALSPEKRALLQRQLRTRGAVAPARDAIPRRTDEGVPPLSFAQQRLWFIDQLEGPNPIYNMRSAVRLRGALDARLLEQAFRAVLDRHEGLRAAFPVQDGTPGIALHAPTAVAFTIELVSEAAFPARLRDVALEPFDLAAAPPVRLCLFRLAQDDHVLLVVLHHILCDGWSLDLLAAELGALAKGGTLPPLPIQYGDFAAWQRGTLQGAWLETELAFWREHLADAPPLLELPTDRPRPPAQTYRGAVTLFTIDRTASAALAGLAHASGASLFMVLLAGFAVLLRRWSGQRDLVIGTPAANRDRLELEGLIGLLVNTLALRIRLEPGMNFRTVLGAVRRVALDAFGHQDLPFDRVVEALRPERNAAHAPVVQVMFSFRQAAATGPSAWPGVTMAPVVLERPAALFDLTMVMNGGADGLDGEIEFNTDLFDAATIDRLVRQFQTLLAAAATEPDTDVDALPLIGSAERRALLAAGTGARNAVPEQDIASLVAAQARLRPDAVALARGPDRWSYAWLDAAANRIANRLLAHGAGPETLVAVTAVASAETVAALLGVLRAGCAYLPLDPRLPAARRDDILRDTGARFLLGAAGDGPPPAVPCLPLDPDAPADPPALRVHPDQLAYVIMTSGSTGRPKGVAVTHRAIGRLVVNSDYVRLAPDDRVAQASTLAFDAATFEIWAPLVAGARIELVERDVLLAPDSFADFLADRDVTTLFLTTALFNRIARARPAAFASLRHVLFGGEACDPRTIAAVLQAGGPEHLLHVYGPTETTTFAAWHKVHDVAEDAATVPIGGPLANTDLHVLDEHGAPVDIGGLGELYIGGPGLARGYLGAPGLTAAAFVPDPLGTTPGARLYRTGDLVRRRADGAIEFVGRHDHQVKIRGFRIEAGEIEAAIAELPGVAETVVIVDRDAEGERRLCAYVAPDTLDTAALRDALRRRLPDYMVPAAWAALPRLPLNANGKVDRSALPRPSLAAAAAASGLDPIEEIVAAAFSELLGQAVEDPDTDFFAAGGHSLLATRLTARLAARLDMELPLRTLFAGPTIREIAAAIGAQRAGDTLLPAVPPRPAGTPPALSFAQQRLWYLDRLEGDRTPFAVPVALHLAGALNLGQLQAALDALVARHEVLRIRIAADGGTPVPVAEPPARVPVAQRDTGDAAALLRAEAGARFDLAAGLPLRVTLMRLGAADQLLVLTLHHIACDGWSVGILLRDLSALYRGETLPALPVQYADYALWQRSLLQGDRLAALSEYWRGQLAGIPPVLDIATDRGRPAERSWAGALHPVTIPADIAAGLRALGQRAGTTLFMTLLAGFAALLQRWSGQDDIVIGAPVSNRLRPELEGLIGFFVNMVPMRIDLAGNPTVAALLDRVRRTTLAAYDHRELPFEQIVEAVQPERSLSHTPIFQAMFVLQTAPGGTLDLPGLTATPVAAETSTAKYDLTLALEESGDGLAGAIEYATELFDPPTIARLGEQLVTLLRGFAEAETPLSRLGLLALAERALVLQGWNDTTRDYPAATLHGLFAAQAARTPDSIALTDGTHDLTYRALDARAAALARALTRRGIGAEALVGVCMERRAEMVVAMLAILKAGAAYVPLDPAYPEERLHLIIRQAAPRLVLTDAAAPIDGEPVAALLAEADEADAPPAIAVPPDSLAYVLYTSGSTGQPKGVAIAHRSAAVLMHWARDTFGAALGHTLASTSICFDLSAFEIFAPLAWGGRVILAENALALATLPAREAVTLINTVPSAAAALAETGAIPRSARTICLAGEPLTAELVERLYRLGSVDHVYDLYGPSEDTTYSTGERVAPGAVPTIGRPVACTSAYVLDAELAPVPIGVKGELYLAGSGLARGYHGRTDLTAERFLPDPFGPPGARMYRTGDAVRWLPDGRLEFLGRLDHQVKLRGFRIELGEIEAALRRLGARDAVAMVREDQPGLRRLVSYVTGIDDTAGLRRAVARALPAFMVPQDWVSLPAMPLSPNGKVDRRALPPPVLPERQGGAAPGTPVETALAEIWRTVLRIPMPGTDDNFFALGGDSILSLQVIALAARHGIAITPKQIFQHQTIAGLAAVATVRHAAGDDAPVTGPVPLTPIQRWFLHRDPPTPSHFNQSVMLALPPGTTEAALRTALDALCRHHDALRLCITRAEGGWRQEIPAPADDPDRLRVYDLPDDPAAVERTAEAVQQSLDIARGVLIRAALLRFSDRDPWLLVVVHHLAVDGVSWRELVEDLLTLLAGRPLPPKTSSFKLWAERLLAHSAADEAGHWRSVIADARPLPRDYDGENRVGDQEGIGFQCDAEHLLTATRTAGGPRLEVVLLAALGRALADWSGDDAPLIDIEGHGRGGLFPELNLSRTVGWFTTLFPVRLRLAGGDDLRAAQDALRAVPNEGLGFLRLYEGSPSGIVLNYLGRFDAAEMALAPGSTGPNLAADTPRAHAIEVTAVLTGDTLRIDLVFSRRLHAHATMAALLEGFRARLDALAEVAAPAEYRAEQFPLLDLGQDELGTLIDAIAETPGRAGTRPHIESIYPLVPSQTGMLLESLAAPGSGIHVEQMAVVLDGTTDPARLGQAWRALLRRHPVLRTGFIWDGRKEPVQFVLAAIPFAITRGDWRDRDADAALEAFLAEDRARGFDLAQPPLLRVALFERADQRFQLIWSFHHILLDGWCIPILMRELAALHDGYRTGAPPHLPPVPPFEAYVQWLRTRDATRTRAFWAERLAGYAPKAALGAHGAAGPAQHGRFVLPAAEFARLRAAARARHVTIATLVQLAWAVVLGGQTGSRDVVFGMTVSGRPTDLPGAADMIGPFFRTLPCRTRLAPEQTVGEALAVLQATQGAQAEFEHATTAEIQGWCGLPAAVPLYETLLVVQNVPAGTVHGAENMPIAQASGRGAETAFPLTLVIVPGEALVIEAISRPDRMPPDRLHRLMEQLLATLRALPGGTIGALLTPIAAEAAPAQGDPARPPYLAPRRTEELVLAKIWEELLGLSPIGVHDDFFALGGHSLLVTQLMAGIRERFGRTLPLATIFAARTVEALAVALRSDAAPWSPLVPIQPHGTRTPLFCIHPLGGNVICYADLAAELQPDQPVYGLQAQGLDAGQAPLRSVGSMADSYLAAMRSVQPHGPYLLLGWSFGGIVAYEMAQRLHATGERVASLVLIDAPNLGALSDAQRYTDTAGLLVSLFALTLDLPLDVLRAVPEEEQLAYVFERAKTVGLVAPGAGLEDARRYFELCKVNHHMPFAPAPYPGRLTLFRGREGAERITTDPTLGWAGLAQGGITVEWLEGSHETMLLAPHLRAAVDRLRDHLAQALSADAGIPA